MGGPRILSAMGNGEPEGPRGPDEPTAPEDSPEPPERPDPGPGGRVRRWSHGVVSVAVVVALIAVIGTVFTFDYLADRADVYVIGRPQSSDVPYTPQPSATEPSTAEEGDSATDRPRPEASSAEVVRPPRATAPPTRPISPAPGQTCVPDAVTTDLSVVSFNIKSARAGDGSLQLERLATTLAAWKPDLVLLQEVDKGRPISGRVDMPAFLGQRLGYYSAFAVNVLRPGNSQYGTAILSRFPILRSENTLLPVRSGEQQRGLLHAVVDVKGVQLSAYVTHLQHTSEAARMRQIATIRDVVAADELPTIVGGDFNARPGSRVMALARTFLTDTWTAVGSGPGHTVPNTAQPRGRIDYLLHSGVEPLSAQVLVPPLSDHQAVAARYAVASTRTVCVPVFD